MDAITFFMYATVSIAGVLLTAWIFALVFQVPKNTRLKKAQVKLLEGIAVKSGMDKDEIYCIMRDFYFK